MNGITMTNTKWFSATTKPEEHKWVIVRDVHNKEYAYHQWTGYTWYSYCRHSDGSYDGWRTLVDVVSWRYQEE